MKKIVATIFILTALASCSASKDANSSTNANTEEPEAPDAPVKVNNYPVK